MVELYARVRQAVVVEGRSQRAAAREFGLHPTDEELSVVTPGWRGRQYARCWRTRCGRATGGSSQ